MDYKSLGWQRKRKQRLILDGRRCRLCDEDGSRYHLEVHHRPSSYKRVPNESVEDDLITLCVRCHDVVTNIIRNDRYLTRKYEMDYLEPKQEETRYVMAKKDIQIKWVQPSNHSQWTTGKPDKQMVTSDEGDFIKEQKDGRRS